MNSTERAELARIALDGYSHGPDANIEAAALATAKAKQSHSVIVVEGISDQIAIETLATRRGRNLNAEGVTVLPAGGAQAVARYLEQFGPKGADKDLSGFCDRDGVETLCRALARAEMGSANSAEDMAGLGFFVCDRDLEDELIRAVGVAAVEEVIASQGELGSLRSLQKQPEWRGRETHLQLHRFFRSHSRRSLRYARLLTEAVPLERVPAALDAALAHV